MFPRNFPNGAQPSADLYRDMMTRFLGPLIIRAFDDPNVTEVYTNPHDRRIWLITHSDGRVDTGERIDPSSVLSFLNTVATSLRTTIGPEHPELQAELPLGGCRHPRLQGLIPPSVESPCFVIRKHAPEIYGIDQLIEAGVLTAGFAAVLRRAVTLHWNILIVGGPRTGKTTMANAILREIAWQCPQERIVLVEDTIELQCESRDHLGLRVREGESLAEPIRRVLRLSPDRIVVGEVRDHAAFYMLDSWLTGCPGSLATVHGSGAENALRRLDLLCQRANVPSQVPLIAAAVELIIELRREEHVRPRVVDVVRVDGLGADGRFLLSRFDPSGEEIGRSHLAATASRRPVRVRRAARSLLVAGCLFAITGITATQGWAAGAGGPEMPWNAPLQNLLDNLSGPTAQTLGMLMFVVGALTWGFSRNEDHIRKFGGIVVGVAVAIGVVNLFNALAFQGAVV